MERAINILKKNKLFRIFEKKDINPMKMGQVLKKRAVGWTSFPIMNLQSNVKAGTVRSAPAPVKAFSGSAVMENPAEVSPFEKKEPKYTGEKISLDLFETDIENVSRILRTSKNELLIFLTPTIVQHEQKTNNLESKLFVM